MKKSTFIAHMSDPKVRPRVNCYRYIDKHGRELAVHRSLVHKESWAVSEPFSGLAITIVRNVIPTRKEAMNLAQEIIKEAGKRAGKDYSNLKEWDALIRKQKITS